MGSNSQVQRDKMERAAACLERQADFMRKHREMVEKEINDIKQKYESLSDEPFPVRYQDTVRSLLAEERRCRLNADNLREMIKEFFDVNDTT